ncbi:MAG TPA: phage major capsid protein [Burkholderiaceae bacterium]|nr:phage major capsid protein [Burkholderiaceae bacterium]
MPSLAEQQVSMKSRRDGALQSMQALVDLAANEERTFTDEETKEFDKFKTETETVNAHIERLDAQEKLIAQSARPAQSLIIPAGNGDTGGGAVQPYVQFNEKKLKPGTTFARYVMALIASRGNMMQAEQIARNYWRDSTPQLADLFKAIGQFGSAHDFVTQNRSAVLVGTTTSSTWAGVLTYATNMASEFIELLRPATIIGQLNGLRRVPFNVRLTRQLTGITSAGWVGEGLSKPVGSLTLDAVLLPWAKVAVIVAMTEELARFSDPSAETLVTEEMKRAIAQFLDLQFIDPAITPTAGVRPGSITNGITPITSTGPTLANITADLATMLSAMASANVPMTAPAWIMHTRTAIYLSLLRSTTDTLLFPTMSGEQKTLLGYPVVTSTASPLGAGPGFLGQIILVDQAQIFLADDGNITLDVSREASIQMDTAPATPPTPLTSLWQQNLIGIKAERYIYWMRRYDPAVQLLTGVPY